MTVVVALADAALHLIDHVAVGEEIIMVRAGRPVARLVPMADPAGRDEPVRRSLQAGVTDPSLPQVQWTGAPRRPAA
ncbi:MAG TPA: type II toxin-antitoxin system prevent-host-death family antitoxin [Aliidongia sp.]|nr:type II toxin-antitoxin system prevent-host-death family antitoxin [Aliidongia sp.]